MNKNSKFIKTTSNPQQYLLIHGWLKVDNNCWIIPNECYPPVTWNLKEACNIQKTTDYVSILEAEGWNVESGGMRDNYYIGKTTMRSPKYFYNNRRVIASVVAAFNKQSKQGWTAKFNEPPILRSFRSNNDVFVWCVYCDIWHLHGTAGRIFGVGETVGHRVEHCTGISKPYGNGYIPKINLVI